jgi:uncharacterized protein YktA (UPF0223 family)/energy-coupling factor transporter ATP-binding protein EcfA2
MSNTLLIMGESGSGKSTSIRTLKPEETFIISVINKPLPFKAFGKLYKNLSSDASKGNYFVTDDHRKIQDLIKNINLKRFDIKNIVIDDFQYIMCNEFMKRASERGYDKFTEIGQHAHSIIDNLMKCRESLTCFVISHTELGDHGKMKCKTIGKMLDDKITIEGMFTVVLHSKIMDGKYRFLVQADGSHIAKSPMDMFDGLSIENDLEFVRSKLYEYYDLDDNNENIVKSIAQEFNEIETEDEIKVKFYDLLKRYPALKDEIIKCKDKRKNELSTDGQIAQSIEKFNSYANGASAGVN